MKSLSASPCQHDGRAGTGVLMMVKSAARIMHDNSLVDTHTLEAARVNGIGRHFHVSSARIHPMYRRESRPIGLCTRIPS